MQNKSIEKIISAIDYIESHLSHSMIGSPILMALR